MTELYLSYTTVFWASMLLVAIVAAKQRNAQLLRCVLILTAQDAALGAYTSSMAGEWAGQPWAAYLLAYAAAGALVTIRPSGRICSVIGGTQIAGAFLSIILGCFQYIHKTDAADLFFWQCNLVLGWMIIAIVIGASSGHGGSRAIGAFRSWFGYMVNRARRSGVA